MPVHATRKLRNLTAALMGLSGFTHIAQLWLFDLDTASLVGAASGVVYLLIALGLAGHSRFTLWIAVLIPGIGVAAAFMGYFTLSVPPLTLFHITLNGLIILFSLYILFRTRHAQMD